MSEFSVVSQVELDSARECVKDAIRVSDSSVDENILLAVLLANRHERKEKGN